MAELAKTVGPNRSASKRSIDRLLCKEYHFKSNWLPSFFLFAYMIFTVMGLSACAITDPSDLTPVQKATKITELVNKGNNTLAKIANERDSFSKQEMIEACEAAHGYFSEANELSHDARKPLYGLIRSSALLGTYFEKLYSNASEAKIYQNAVLNLNSSNAGDRSNALKVKDQFDGLDRKYQQVLTEIISEAGGSLDRIEEKKLEYRKVGRQQFAMTKRYLLRFHRFIAKKRKDDYAIYMNLYDACSRLGEYEEAYNWGLHFYNEAPGLSAKDKALYKEKFLKPMRQRIEEVAGESNKSN